MSITATKAHAYVESPALKNARVAIRPYLSGASNNGLEEFNMILHEGIHHTDSVIIERFDKNVKSYRVPNEFSAEIFNMEEGEEKQAKIRSIRKLLADAENLIGGNNGVSVNALGQYKVHGVDKEGKPVTTLVGIEDMPSEDFYKHISMFKASQVDTYDQKGDRMPNFWDELTLELDNDGTILDEEDIKHRLIVAVIECGGFGLIAKSYEDAIAEGGKKKFYLHRRAKVAAIKIGDKILRDEAGNKLVQMYKNDFNKLFYITKLIAYNSDEFKTGKNATPQEVFYEECSNFLASEGDHIGLSMKDTATRFLELANKAMTDLVPMLLLKDARDYKFIVMKDGLWYYWDTQVPLGKTDAECIEFLKNGKNSGTLEAIQKKVDKKWNE